MLGLDIEMVQTRSGTVMMFLNGCLGSELLGKEVHGCREGDSVVRVVGVRED